MKLRFTNNQRMIAVLFPSVTALIQGNVKKLGKKQQRII